MHDSEYWLFWKIGLMLWCVCAYPKVKLCYGKDMTRITGDGTEQHYCIQHRIAIADNDSTNPNLTKRKKKVPSETIVHLRDTFPTKPSNSPIE